MFKGSLKKIATIAVGVTLLAGLAACSSSSTNASCDPKVSSGDQSDQVTVSKSLKSAPTVKFDTPFHASKTEASVVVEGKGAKIQGAQSIVADLTIVNGTTGDTITASSYDGSDAATFVVDQVPLTGLAKALECAQVGERLAVTIPPKAAFPEASLPTGVSKDDSIIIVVDVKDAYLARAEGADQVPPAGLPSVVLAATDGRPGITIPDKSKPLTKLTIADLIAGDGAKVKKDDTVLIQYTGVLWKDGKVFDSSWEKESGPIPIPLATTSLIKGFTKALVGQKVGSQVIAVIPPSDGYGDTANDAVPANSTLVFVIDILGTQPASATTGQ